MDGKYKLTLVGVDVGTGGVRIAAATPAGELLAKVEGVFKSDYRTPEGIHEQDPLEWWNVLTSALNEVMQGLAAVSPRVRVGGLAVASTSGSLVTADESGQPLRPAILYDDRRGAEIAEQLDRAVADPSVQLGTSHSLVKAAWVREAEPEVWDRTRYLLHPADWLTGKLTGEFGRSDYSNALKLGYEPETGTWGKAVFTARLPRERLPEVFPTAEQVGVVSRTAAAQTGLRARTPVVAGATDGVASFIASGASQLGDASTTLGTTLVWKVLARDKPPPAAGIYSHLHPNGAWIPGAASNTGFGCLRTEGSSVPPAEFDRLAAAHFPTPIVCYLLPGRGERFPFANPQAESFAEGRASDPGEWYAAQLQSLGFVERWGYENVEKCGVPVANVILSGGEAARSQIVLKLRSSILRRTVARTCYPNAAFGAAIIAAAAAAFSGNVCAATQAMTRIEEAFSPSDTFALKMDEIYGAFRVACSRRGYGC